MPLGTWEHLCGAAQPADCFPLVQIWGEKWSCRVLDVAPGNWAQLGREHSGKHL